ncbi:MAG: phosphoenolpyruvate synthase [Acidimicrobiia bacterium]|nr:phosphoenolpyruvate synthase [bacterium]MXX64167.1 phosphoenolpyruvate synthase [Acidimicrobiia bacterium]MXZ06583.1 phosphoenolpyruvate synthase [Acidimicrobiia bacterium]MYD05320.1 phosphoenolpyruvate synthase [Acidimicrobiia bacterium]MYH54927.1 phosphoenolpyruvate synthase [Acidimicrobiia bacterium]
MAELIRWFNEVSLKDIGVVGGKNASLGEMYSNLGSLGVVVPNGFATTVDAYRLFMAESGLDDRVGRLIDSTDRQDHEVLEKVGRDIRRWVAGAPVPERLVDEIGAAYQELTSQAGEAMVAVRSSATAEDLPDASFAGLQDTYLGLKGADRVVRAVRDVFASLYSHRALDYRIRTGHHEQQVSISAGVQQMVHSQASGVVFTIDTESGFEGVVFITGTYGLGELLVQGSVNPDEFYVAKRNLAAGRPAVISRTLGTKTQQMVFGELIGSEVVIEDVPLAAQRRFCLSDQEIEELARQAVVIEDYYGRPMDIEWAKDALDGRIYIVQARPETARSKDDRGTLTRFSLDEGGTPVVTGRSVGQRIGAGTVRIVHSPREMSRVAEGDVLVADMTDPDWEPVMQRASAIVTNRGGRTCHAAIIARELGVPAVVGSGNATRLLADGQKVTVSCAEGETGRVYEGILPFRTKVVRLDHMPEPPTKIMMNVGNPSRAFGFSRIPNHGVGLARMEFIINNAIGVHPKALLDYPEVPDKVKAGIEERMAGYTNPKNFFITKLVEGIATLALGFYPKPVIVRLSDFKSNEYAHLLGGTVYEPTEENPMLGFRGASRYRSSDFSDVFSLECEALRRVRGDLGLDNIEVMVPFVRTLEEAESVLEVMAGNGLCRGEDGLRVIMMCEIPSNALLAPRFLEYFDGFSIGSNDLAQLTLALDRDSELVADLFDERNQAVKELIRLAVEACREAGKYIGICGQGPSDYPDLAAWLVEAGLESLSLNPDTVVETWLHLSGKKE